MRQASLWQRLALEVTFGKSDLLRCAAYADNRPLTPDPSPAGGEGSCEELGEELHSWIVRRKSRNPQFDDSYIG